MTAPLLSRRTVAVLALGFLGAGSAAGCSPTAEINPPAEIGDIRTLDDPDLEGASFAVAMPDGTYTVTGVGVRDSAGPEAHRMKAPEGAVIITLAEGNLEFAGSSQPVRTRTTFQVAAGGRTYVIDGSLTQGGTGIAVPGDGSDAVIEVLHEGRTARFAVADGARLDDETLYVTTDGTHLGATLEEEDGFAYQEGIAPEVGLSLSHTTFSTMGGWAPKGKAWLEAGGIGVSSEGEVLRGSAAVATVTTITSRRLIVDGSPVETETGRTQVGVELAWAQVPLDSLEAALEITYDIGAGAETLAEGLTVTMDAVELDGLTA